MEKGEDKFVYFCGYRSEYQEISDVHLKDFAALTKYFGNSGLDEHMHNDELIFYKLVPYLRVTKNVEYKSEEI